LGRLIVLLLAGCVTTPAVPPADSSPGAAVRERLKSLPKCQPGAEVGLLIPRATICTKKHCQERCCNQCSWAATFQSTNGEALPVEPQRVQALLGVPEGALDCEIAAWADALATQSVSIDAPGCVVR
jgi:hypothetical protein